MGWAVRRDDAAVVLDVGDFVADTLADKIRQPTTGFLEYHLRPESETFLRHVGVELTGGNRRMLYVPEGFAHGFITLADNSEVLYNISEFWSPEHARGVRWNDPVFGVNWPVEPAMMSDRDRNYPDFIPARSGVAAC